MTSAAEDKDGIPHLIEDVGARTVYQRNRFFGKGGFAKCYEIVNVKTKEVFAGKIVSKKLMVKSNQKDKMAQEISIHRSLKHHHVVQFYSFFEDSMNIYIVLELCKRRSMMELHKRRKAITEPETRYYMAQVLQGVHYLHSNRIIHRDLKLGNLFLDDNLHVKIGDFGLAAQLEFDGEQKQTLCGTPNYIAPEILSRKGHSFEVDIWSIGCIMFTLLVGKPPFETTTLKETYKKIKTCDYRLPQILSPTASSIIKLTLQPDPSSRPSVDHLLRHEFFLSGFHPSSLPLSCLTTAPRLDQLEALENNSRGRRPLIELNSKEMVSTSDANKKKPPTGSVWQEPSHSKSHLITLKQQLVDLLSTKPGEKRNNLLGDDCSDPEAQPLVWISKWVDYSDKYGFGYQLCDESVAVSFNDTSKMIMLSNGIDAHYIDRNGKEIYMTVDSYPESLEKKMKLLKYFQRYMNDHLVKAGAGIAVCEADKLSRVPYIQQWSRTKSSITMQLTNGTVQINSIDHSKIILCPLMASVTYMKPGANITTYRFSTIEANGCSSKLHQFLFYAVDKISDLISKSD